MIISTIDRDMTSTLILTSVNIKDTDLFISKDKRIYQLVDSINNLDEDLVVTVGDGYVDTNLSSEELAERELMRSMGLPMAFTTNRVVNKRCEKVSQHLSQSVTQMNGYNKRNNRRKGKGSAEPHLKCYKEVKALTQKLSEMCERTVTDELYPKSTDEQQVMDWDVLKGEHLWLDLSDADAKQEPTPPAEDKSTPVDNRNVISNNQSDVRSTSGARGLVVNSFLNDGGSDSDDEPPEERPTVVKRSHESDSIDLSEDLSEKGETQIQEPKRERVVQKRPKSKYWHQRYRLFSRFDEGIRMDSESWYSVTPERIAQHIAHRFSLINDNYIIIDAFCGAGGNTIQFALISGFVKVIAIDIDAEKIKCAKNNAKIYGVDHKIEFICGDYLVLAKTGALVGDAVFLSPPWGGPEYLNLANYTLDMMSPSGSDVYNVTKNHITCNIGILLPRNIHVEGVEQLAGEGNSVEIEANIMNSKIKTKTAYFGNLIKSQS